MNDNKLKQAFQTIYQPPKPARKYAFLNSIETSQLSVPQFLLSQIGYIRPWGWMLSIAVFVTAMLVMWNQQAKAIWMVSAFMPFVALSTVVELNRSAHYKMEELELAARFSLKAVMLARMSILGLGNMILLAALSPFVVQWGHLTMVETGFYILCPYCLTTFLSLMIIRRWRRSENIYACAGMSAAISVLCCVSDKLPSFLQGTANVSSYAGVTLLLLTLMLWECKNYLFNVEEYKWN